MQIHGLQTSNAVQSLAASGRAKPTQATPAEATSSPAVVDQLELSAEALALGDTSSVQSDTGIRQDRINALRQAIAEGTYDTPERLSAALDKMLDTFA